MATKIGLRRQGVLHHFRSKAALYDAVAADVCDALLSRLRQALARDMPLESRVEAAVMAWTDYLAERPTMALLVLREAAEPRLGTAQLEPARELVALLGELLADAEREGSLQPLVQHPVRVVSLIIGATVFWATAQPTVPGLEDEASRADALRRDRAAILHMARHLVTALEDGR